MHKKRLAVFILLFVVVAVLTTTYICNAVIANSAKGKLYNSTKTIPYNKVGLLLGTSKFVNKHVNPFYSYRIQAAAALIKDHKIKYLIISGDNGSKYYNEPERMREDLVNDGIDS